MDNKTIIIIGPIGVGKTTQAKLLSRYLGLPRCSYDEVKATYWSALGLEKKEAQRIEKEHGLYAMLTYMYRYKVRVVGSIVKNHPNHVIDFGGSAQTFDDPKQVEKTRQLFEPLSNVFLLMPSKDVTTSITSLPGLKEDLSINAYLILHPTNELFAKHTVYTLGKTPEAIMHEIIAKLDF